MRAIALSLLLQGADAIVRRSDVPDSQYVIDHSIHPEIVAVNPGGSLRSRRNVTGGFNVECGGTMVSKSHVITAAHCFEDGASQSGFAVNVNGKKLNAKTVHFNPNCVFKLKQDGPNRCDTAIVELDGEADVTPMPVYRWSDETGKHMDTYGWGVTGTADKITSKECDDGPEDGKFRHGENTVESVSAPSGGGGIIYYTMRKNGQGLPLEAISASGDSGSPVYIKGPDGNMYIAGTNSGSDDNNGCIYGSTDQYCRLSQHYEWITSVIGPSPPSPPSPPGPFPPSPTPPGPKPPTPHGKCTQKCLDAAMEQCPQKDFPTYHKCVVCGDKDGPVQDDCNTEGAFKDCCDALHPDELAVTVVRLLRSVMFERVCCDAM